MTDCLDEVGLWACLGRGTVLIMLIGCTKTQTTVGSPGPRVCPELVSGENGLRRKYSCVCPLSVLVWGGDVMGCSPEAWAEQALSPRGFLAFYESSRTKLNQVELWCFC